MAADTAPIELPTGRRSYIAPAHESPNVNNPNWIPVLSNVDLQKLSQYMEKEETPQTPQTPTASYSPFPPRPSSPRPSSPPKAKHYEYLHHKYSKSSLAPETVPSELEAEPLPPRTSSKKDVSPSPIVADSPSPHLRHRSADAPSSDGQETVTSDNTAEASAAPSTVGTASLVEDQYYTLPDTSLTKEDIQPPQIMSGRSSVASTRTKSGVMPPTSKYNRKHTSSLPGRPATIKSEPVTPHDSPRMSPQPPSPVAIPVSEPLPSPQVPFPTQAPPIPDTGSKLHASKSTVSERRLRALNSHPSKVSQASQARSRPGSTSDEDGIEPKPPSLRHQPRKSTDSRPGTSRSTIYDGQTPTPAPTTPLPQLPPEARTRPTTREGPTQKPIIQPPPEAHVASHVAPTNPVKSSDHTQMASFMTARSQVIFRRFDDVHIKLLLCLQDEITQLEQELSALETGTPATGDVTLQKMRVMRELRRVIAEYGEFSSGRSHGR
jgi:hypothetical protein